MANTTIGYQGFEDPEHTYYGAGTTQNVPAVYTGAYQVRQFGVGGTLGRPVTVTKALASAPSAMTTAEAAALTAPVVTSNDIARYYPSTTTNPNF